MPDSACAGNVPVDESPYSAFSHTYLERGLPAIPAMAGGKVPGILEDGNWRPMPGWQRYADYLPAPAEVEMWGAWAGAGIALPLGGVSGVMAIDIDVEGEPMVALERELAGFLVCRKRGRKGYTAFLRVGDTPWGGKNDLPSKFNITLPDAPTDRHGGDLQPTRAVDIIAYGKQTIMPPSIHPNGMAYQWMTALRLDDCMVDDLPVCPPDLVERITRALEPWTTDVDRAFALRQQHVARMNETDSWFRSLNNHALDNLQSWVPELVPSQFLQANGQGYRAKPYWRGVTDAFKVSITPKGIKDFAQDQGYTPIDLVMSIRGVSVSDAIDWLAHASRMPTESVATEGFFAALRQWTTPVAPVMHHILDTKRDNVQVIKHLPPAVVLPAVPDQAVPVKQQSNAHAIECTVVEAQAPVVLSSPIKDAIADLPRCVTEPPGILGDIARHITASAFRPQPQLSVAAAITFVATVTGQVYRGPTGSRTNLYLAGIARTGAGKDHPFKSVTMMLNAVGLADCIGGSSMASGTAIHSRLASQPNTVYLIDELGLLLSRLKSESAGGHEREVLDVLMQAYTSADSPIFKGKDYADRNARNTSVARYPCLNIFGVTTPAALYDSMSGSDMASGFLNRWLLVESNEFPRPQFDRAEAADVPETVLEWATLVRNPRPVDGAPLRGLTPEAPVLVPYADAAVRTAARQLVYENDDRIRELARTGDGIESMLARLPEQIGKLAIVAAVANQPDQPAITMDAWNWAVEYGTHTNSRMLEALRSRVAGSQFEGLVKKCLIDLEARGTAGLTVRDMGKTMRSWRALDRRDRDKVIDRLLETEQAMWITPESGAKRLVAAGKVIA